MKRRQGASAAEKKAREHPPRKKKREKQRRSVVKTVKPQDSHTVHRVLMSTLSLFYIYNYFSFSLLVINSESAQEYNSFI
jgi:hypothetical protein